MSLAGKSDPADLARWFLSVIGVCLLRTPAVCQTPEAKTAVMSYLQAAQKRDHETLMKLSFRYQSQVRDTTKGSPRILLSKRLAELHDRTLSRIATELPNALPDFVGFDTDEEARLAMKLLPAAANWKIVEWQPRRRRTNEFGPYLTFYTAYVRIAYPSREVAPSIKIGFIDEKTEALKECLLAVEVPAVLPEIFGVDRMPEADRYWEARPSSGGGGSSSGDSNARGVGAAGHLVAMDGGGGPQLGNDSPFGAQFGAYAKLLRDSVARQWSTSDFDSRSVPPPVVTFTILRDGSLAPGSVRLTERSGNAALDISAQRAVLDAAPFPPLPQEFSRNEVQVELRFYPKEVLPPVAMTAPMVGQQAPRP